MQVPHLFGLSFLDAICLQVKGSDVNEDEEVDIVALEKDDAFSDSDMSQEELCFLPATPSPDDIPEQQEKFVESSPKLIDSNNTGSPLSENGTNGHMNHASSPLDGNIMPCIICL